MKEMSRSRNIGGRGPVFYPVWAASVLSSSKYVKHHHDILGLVAGLPTEPFTAKDLLKSGWGNGEVSPVKASIILKIIYSCGLLTRCGENKTKNRIWKVSPNHKKLMKWLEERDMNEEDFIEKARKRVMELRADGKELRAKELEMAINKVITILGGDDAS